MSDAINPDHYKRLPAEAIEIIEAAIDNAPSVQAAYLHGQALKYLLRCWYKNGIEDLRKAKWYLDRLIESFDDSEPEQPKPTLNSDKIPEGYRKLKNSSVEPRQRGDLRWSVAERRYIEIGFDEIGYANRDNWAACRRIEPVIKQSSTTEPPDGWRWIEVGETLRRGDTTNTIDEIPETCIDTKCVVKHFALRRNRFEVGEKVVHINGIHACVVVECDHEKDQYVIVYNGRKYVYESKCLVPYIEDAK